jgi:hypothetical protein
MTETTVEFAAAGGHNILEFGPPVCSATPHETVYGSIRVPRVGLTSRGLLERRRYIGGMKLASFPFELARGCCEMVASASRRDTPIVAWHGSAWESGPLERNRPVGNGMIGRI